MYPDTTVVCGKPKFLVEAQPPSTEGADRSAKWPFDLRIPALHHYVLLASQRPRSEVPPGPTPR